MKSPPYFSTLKKTARYLCPAFLLPVILITIVDFQRDFQRVDQWLFNMAQSVPLLLAEDFHDRATGPDSISYEEELWNRKMFNQYNAFNDLTWVYTVIEKDGQIYFTAPTVTDEEARELKSWYFYEYDDADQVFYDALKTGETRYENYSDQWGHFRTIILPQDSPGGNRYAVCIDLARSNYVKLIIKTTGLKILILLVSFFLVVLYISRLTSTSPGKLKAEHVLMSRKDLEQIINFQTRHLQQLSDNEKINNLQLTNALYAGQMSLFTFSIKTGKLVHTYNNLFSETLGYKHGQYELDLKWLCENMVDQNFIPQLKDIWIKLLSCRIPQESLDVKLKDIRGKYHWFRLNLSLQKGDSREKDSLLVLTQSIEDIKKRERKLLKQVHTDELTGFYNRAYWEEYFKSLKNKNRRSDMPLVICFIDINGLKTVNDNLGHHAGDKLLIDFSTLLRKTIRGTDNAIRLGGNEFLLLCSQTYENEFDGFWQKLQENTNQFNTTMGRDYLLSFCHGICILYNQVDNREITPLLEEADRKMYEEKHLMKQDGLSVLRNYKFQVIP